MRRITRTAIVGVALMALPAAAQAATVHFTSPSGNIDCRSDGPGSVGCVVQKAQWGNAPARPANCEWDWMPSEVFLDRRGVRVGACRGDVGPLCVDGVSGDTCTVLRYGRSVRIAGGVRCTSLASGVVCRFNNGRGKGFKVSRQGYTVYR